MPLNPGPTAPNHEVMLEELPAGMRSFRQQIGWYAAQDRYSASTSFCISLTRMSARRFASAMESLQLAASSRVLVRAVLLGSPRHGLGDDGRRRPLCDRQRGGGRARRRLGCCRQLAGAGAASRGEDEGKEKHERSRARDRRAHGRSNWDASARDVPNLGLQGADVPSRP